MSEDCVALGLATYGIITWVTANYLPRRTWGPIWIVNAVIAYWIVFT